jgi:hypothetical protein
MVTGLGIVSLRDVVRRLLADASSTSTHQTSSTAGLRRMFGNAFL